MIRLFIYLIIILALGFGFAWIADNPGVVTLNWQGKDIRTSLMVVVIAIGALLFVLLFIWGLFRGVIGFPSFLSRYFTNRRRDRGYQALSKGLIAAGTGDKDLARRLSKESGKLLKNEPLVELLDAQTCLLEGNREAARGRFQTMLSSEDTKLLGLRGLYLEAEREGEREASRLYAEEASQLAPTLAWAGNAKLRNLSKDGDWEAALGTLESNRAAGLIDKDTAKRHRAVLLTARAIDEEPTNPELAAKLAKEAHRLAPDLVPAAVIGAKALVRGNNLRKASKLIEAVWKRAPHPELAQSYIHLRMGDSATDRLKRARNLAKMRTNHPEGNMAIAEAAMDAKDWEAAREAMKSVLANNITERACLIMADIEEGEYADAGRMRDWLSRAVRAPRDAKWTAEGYTSETWLPISPVSGEIDVFEWKVPVEQLQISNDTIDIGDLAEPLKPQIPAALVEVPAKEQLADGDNIKPQVAAVAAGAIVAGNIGDEDSKDTDIAEGVSSEASIEEDVSTDIVEEANVIELMPEKSEIVEGKAENSEGEKSEKIAPEIETDENQASGEEEEKPTTAVFPLPRRPDDPGVEQNDSNKNKSFKIF
ncbi:MAG: heme biosynthesis protein HemY [Rhizobiaceae bacterium]|nr:heme biosynthesis protein HemY [Rhizobiaceae bacterium]